MNGRRQNQAVWNGFKLLAFVTAMPAAARSVVTRGDVDQHVYGTYVMAFGRARKIGQRHLVGRNVDQLVAVGIIEVMVMVGVGVKDAVLVMDGDAPKQTGLGELVQRIVDGAASHMRSGLPDFAGKPVGGHMSVTTVKKKPGDQ